MKNKLPPCFAFRNSGKHPRKDEIKKRFNELAGKEFSFNNEDVYYGRNSGGFYDWFRYISNFGSTVVEITEDDFLAMTEPELTKLPDNFYFQYVDEKDREVLRERFGRGYVFYTQFLNHYYGVNNGMDSTAIMKDGMLVCVSNKFNFDGATEITQADFIRLTEPATTYKGDIKDFPKEVVEWMLDNQVKQGNKRDVSVFEKCRHDGNENGGFDWCIVDSHFCYDVIYNKNFDLFFEKYPNYTSPEKTITGQIIEISERGILIELTKEQIKEFKIFETVTIK
jgi:hypothetical protein